jgi:hypothetical protein
VDLLAGAMKLIIFSGPRCRGAHDGLVVSSFADWCPGLHQRPGFKLATASSIPRQNEFALTHSHARPNSRHLHPLVAPVM